MFIGFNPYMKSDNFLALDIAENEKNAELENENIHFEEDWYYVPILNSEILAGDEKVLEEIRTRLSEKKITFPTYFEKALPAFYSLKEKMRALYSKYELKDTFDEDEWFSLFEADGIKNKTFTEFLLADSEDAQRKAFRELADIAGLK